MVDKHSEEYYRTVQQKLDYTKADLLDMLKRHTNTDKKCDCSCPYTGNSIFILLDFLQIEFNLPVELIDYAKLLYNKITENSCITGDRLVTTASLLRMVYIRVPKYNDWIIESLGESLSIPFFCIILYSSYGGVRTKTSKLEKLFQARKLEI